MGEIRYTLISDGTSDRTLLEVIKWLFNDVYPEVSANGSYCDFGQLRHPPQNGDVLRRIEVANQLSPFDICFYHRDAESMRVVQVVSARTKEIQRALPDALKNIVICLIPVKMMETWLLISKEAIKAAAGNRNYKGDLSLPKFSGLESHQSPKATLHDLLRQATGNSGRRLKNFNVDRAVHLVAENIDDYSRLRKLKAFCLFEAEMRRVVDSYLKR